MWLTHMWTTDMRAAATAQISLTAEVFQLVQAMEADPSVTQAGNEELLTTLVENYMGKDSNFSFMILDSDKYRIAASGDDAKERIEGSNHYVALSNTDGQTTVQSPIAGKLLNKDEWTEKLAAASNKYLFSCWQ